MKGRGAPCRTDGRTEEAAQTRVKHAVTQLQKPHSLRFGEMKTALRRLGLGRLAR